MFYCRINPEQGFLSCFLRLNLLRTDNDVGAGGRAGPGEREFEILTRLIEVKLFFVAVLVPVVVSPEIESFCCFLCLFRPVKVTAN